MLSKLIAATLALSSTRFEYVPLKSSECSSVGNMAKLPKCGDSSIVAGMICKGGKAPGTDKDLNNCGNKDLYRAEVSLCRATLLKDDELPRQCKKPRKKKNKKVLKKLPDCTEANPGEICEGSGECGTSNRANNCGKFDLYRREEDSTGSSSPATPAPFDPLNYPAFSQMCADDSGPPWADEEEAYGKGKRYHTNSKAIAVLKDQQCASPVKHACEARAGSGPITPEVARAAYLEGPLQCGGKGWFCRILPDGGHDGGRQTDWNFNHCNRTDYGDTDGHCHGSDDDDVFYWWVRDHWHRNYAGRLHCCCNWGATLGVVARCDYRAAIPKGQAKNCRDANEDHTGPGTGFSLGFEEGCPNLGASSLPEPDEGQCWDVLNFAPGFEGDDDDR